MGYYSGNGFAIHSPYIQHYGRKGMKWYQNIFEDFGTAVKSAYSGAKTADTKRRMQAANAQASKIVEADRLANGGHNTAGFNTNRIANDIYAKSSRGYASYGKIYGRENALNYNSANANSRDKAIINAGNFIGTTAYNATVVARKIADAAKTAWRTVKNAGSALINKGRDLLSGLFGRKKKESKSSETPVTKSAPEKNSRDYKVEQKTDSTFNQQRFDNEQQTRKITKKSSNIASSFRAGNASKVKVVTKKR